MDLNFWERPDESFGILSETGESFPALINKVNMLKRLYNREDFFARSAASMQHIETWR